MTASPRSPLGALADAMAAASGEDLLLRELAFLSQVNLRADAADPALAGALAEALGFALPTTPNTTARAGERTGLWLGPDEWLIVGPAGTQAATEAALRGALGGAFGSVVDVSANRTTLQLAGPHARDVLAKGCSLDLHPRAFAPGRCAQANLARAQVILEQRDETPAYRIFVRASFAEYLAAWLVDAMAEYGAAQAPPRRSSSSRRQRSVRPTSLNV